MAKRSPILGYNHNLRYRGLVFHVQTEDSGVLSPHLFTHLFHGGVIVSTRKLVYDAGSNEEAIKALMQAQHKAVMKDLKKGAFDNKIDQYLGGTEGLEPRAAGAADRAKTELDPGLAATVAEVAAATPSEVPEMTSAAATIPNVTPSRAPTPPRVPTPAQAPKPAAPPTARSTHPRAATPPPVPARAKDDPDSSPVIEISIDDDSSVRLRAPRDTVEEGTQAAAEKRSTPSLGAATLPPVARASTRPPSRPAIQTPAVVTRPASEGSRSRRDSDVVEVYAPPPPSVDPPPGARPESRGAYSVSRASKEQGDVPLREQTGRIAATPIPAGLGRPRVQSNRTPVAGSQTPRPPAEVSRTQPDAPRVAAAPRARTPTPARIPQMGAVGARPGAPGVVMSRPAVIVGAPAKAATTGSQRVRKASEDAGRGFGQGLISEKSLDEVILAYLSEDAEGEK